MDVFGALADPVRRRLLVEIASGPARVTDLAALHPISRPAISRHLRLLSEAGLVAAEDRGRERHYALVTSALSPVAGLLDRLAPADGRISSQAIDALETEVRRTVRDRRTSNPSATPRQETA